MQDNQDDPQPPPEPVGGFRHIFAATGYSAAGFACLIKQTAFKLEFGAAIGLFVLFALIGAELAQFLILALFVLLVFCVEALNAAIEMIVDEISPHRSEFARNTKDLGSFAVACTQLGTSRYAAYVLFSNPVS